MIDYITRECPICGKQYLADPQRLKHGRQTTCSLQCSYQLRASKSKVPDNKYTCTHCGKVTTSVPSLTEGRKYCSLACYHAARAQQAGYKGALQYRFCLICGASFKQKDRFHKYCSRACFEVAHKDAMTGENNPSYLDGRSIHANYDAGAAWHDIRRQVYERDEYVCQSCGVKCVSKSTATKYPHYSHRIIQCHHINPYKESQNNSLDNLTTLCIRCHRKAHTARGEYGLSA